MTSFTFRKPDDFHLHLRQGEPMAEWARSSARSFARALVMPNTVPPLSTPERVAGYRAEILSAVASEPACAPFMPLMSFKLLPGMTAREVRLLKEAGCVAGKYYPAGATTNSADGISSPGSIREALAAMEEEGIVLSVHAEDPEAPAFEREAAFLPRVKDICVAYPGLRIVVEHLSLASSLDWLAAMPERVAGTLTLHHLLYCIDDMLGEGLNPHLFCKPILKSSFDRSALREAALSGSPRLFFGSDSAPHPRARKESASAPGGVFSAPAALPFLFDFFLRSGRLERFEAFVSENGARFYGLPLNEGRLRVAEGRGSVPEEVGGALPLLAGRPLPWSFVEA